MTWYGNSLEDVNVLVVGATGGIGREIVSQLFSQRANVRAFVRDAARARPVLGPYISLNLGDVRAPYTIRPALEEVQQIVCTLGSRAGEPYTTPEEVEYEGVRHLVQAALDARLTQFVLISSLAVRHTDKANDGMADILRWKLQAETFLRQSGLAYTIVRPGILTDEPGGRKRVHFGQGAYLTGEISRADTAAVCVEALRQPAARNATFEIVAGEEQPERDWTDKFLSLQPDTVNDPNI